MSYVFDTSALSALFRNFYRNRFPTLWNRFDDIVEGGRLNSTREVFREIEGRAPESLREWTRNQQGLFVAPNGREAAFVADIFRVAHFRHNIEQQKILKGGLNADPFVIAKARVTDAAVVTMEQLRPHAAKIPNICEHFEILCLSLEAFMEREGWRF